MYSDSRDVKCVSGAIPSSLILTERLKCKCSKCSSREAAATDRREVRRNESVCKRRAHPSVISSSSSSVTFNRNKSQVINLTLSVHVADKSVCFFILCTYMKVHTTQACTRTSAHRHMRIHMHKTQTQSQRQIQVMCLYVVCMHKWTCAYRGFGQIQIGEIM